MPLHEYKYVNFGDFVYTTDFGELGSGCCGYTYLGVSMYIYNAQAEGTIPLYRFYNGTLVKHFYTTNFNELGGDPDWDYEGVQGFVFAQQESGTVPIQRWLGWRSGGPVHVYVIDSRHDEFFELYGFVFEGVVGYAVAP